MPRRGYELAPLPRSTRTSMVRSSRGTRSSYGSTINSAIRRYGKRRGLRKALPGYTDKSPFPPSKGYKLHYEQSGALTVGTTGLTGSIQEFNINSLYDPDRTGTGHQPYGFDALAVAYNRYKVNGVFIDLMFYNTGLGAIDCVYSIMNPSNVSDSIAGLTPEQVAERQNAEGVILNNTGSQRKRVKFYLPMAKAFGITKLQYKTDLDNSTASVGGSPGSLSTIQLACADPNGGSSGGCRYRMKLTYYVTMYQREIMAQS